MTKYLCFGAVAMAGTIILALPAIAQMQTTDQETPGQNTTGQTQMTPNSDTQRTQNSGQISQGGMAAMAPTDFVTQAAMSDMFEIQSSQLAAQRSQNAQVRAFAQQMINDHTRSSTELKAAVASEGLAAPDTRLDAKHQAKLTDLQGTPAGEFDDKYIDLQKAAHDKAVSMFESYSRNGRDGAVKTFAAKTLPALRMHFDHVRTLDGAGSGGANPDGQNHNQNETDQHKGTEQQGAQQQGAQQQGTQQQGIQQQ